MKHIFSSLVLLASTGLLFGCSSDKAAVQSAIAKVVEREGNHLVCAEVFTEGGHFPFAYRADGILNYGANKATLDQLVAAGFLKTRQTMVKPIYGGLSNELNGPLNETQAVEYDVTPLGQKYAQGNKFCLPSQMAETEVEANKEERTLAVTQYFSAERNAETARLSKVLSALNPNLGLIMEKDLPMRFQIRKSIKNTIQSVEKLG